MSESTGNQPHSTDSTAQQAQPSSARPAAQSAPGTMGTSAMSTNDKSAGDSATYIESAEELAYANRPFRGWRLLGVIGVVVVILALVSAAVDWVVIGPLEGRVF